jgi:hypothetical protein
LIEEMDVVTAYWMGVDTELKDIDNRVKALRGDHMLQMKIRSLARDWEGVEKNHKLYINTVRVVHICMNESSTYSFSAQHTPESQPTIQGNCRFKSRDNGRRAQVRDEERGESPN